MVIRLPSLPGQPQGAQSTANKYIKLPSLPEVKKAEPTVPYAVENLPQTMSALEELQKNPLSLLKDDTNKTPPIDTRTPFLKSLGESLKRGIGKLIESNRQFRQAKTPTDVVSSSLKSITGAADVAFSPITALFAAADSVPVLGTVSRLVSLPFIAAGEAGAGIAGNLVDKIPDDVMSPEAKVKLKPEIQEVVSLASQMIIGEAAGGIFSREKAAQLESKYGTHDAYTITEQASKVALDKLDAEVRSLPPPERTIGGGPTLALPEGRKAVYGEGFVMGEYDKMKGAYMKALDEYRSASRAHIKAPTPKTLDRVRNAQDALSAKWEAVKKSTEQARSGAAQPRVVRAEGGKIQLPPPDSVVAPEVRTREVSPPEVSEAKPSGVAVSVADQKLVRDTVDTFSGLAEYTPVTVADQLRRSNDVIRGDIEATRRIVRGEEPLPSDILSGAFIKAVEDHAVKVGDAGLLKDLASSPLTSETSVHAQEMRLLRERAVESPIAAIKNIVSARLERAKVAGRDVVKEVSGAVSDIKAEIKKRSTKQNWADFVDSLRC